MNKEQKDLLLVSGNRSGDLDSLISSYVKGELLRLEYGDTAEVEVLFHLPESEWRLHPEAQLIFKECSADLSQVRFLNDLISMDLQRKKQESKLKIILTDHNSPEHDFMLFSDSVVEIIDHHTIRSPIGDHVLKTINNTGSCSTLVAEQFLYYLKNNPEISDNKIISSLAGLLYFTIRIDTDHLKGNNHYNLQRDRKALEKLRPLTDLPEDFLKDLKREKNNTEHFTQEDHLLSDFKRFYSNSLSYGISTVHLNLEEFSALDGDSIETINIFMKKKDIEILFMMHSLKKPIFKRELTVFFSANCAFSENIIGKITDSDLFKRKKVSPPNEDLYLFSQENPDYSRKKIQPFLEKILYAIEDQYE